MVEVQDFGLGRQLDTRAVPHNYWFSVLEMDARQMIAAFVGEQMIPFAMTESEKIQAAASYDPKVILVSGGLVDTICRFSFRLVDAGTFVAFGNAEPNWKPSVDRSFETLQQLLRDEPFCWDSANIPWIENDERVQLFAFLTISLHRFVVLHELGHVVYGHGKRTDVDSHLIIDGLDTDFADETVAITSQAKELAADAYAINSLRRLFEHEFDRLELDPMRELLKSKLMNSPRERLGMVLFVAFAVFQILDRRNWTINLAMKASHPPAPARVKAAYATALEMKLEGVSAEDLQNIVREEHLRSHAVVSVGFDCYPDFDWIRRLDDAKFDAFMLKVVEEVPQHMEIDSCFNAPLPHPPPDTAPNTKTTPPTTNTTAPPPTKQACKTPSHHRPG